jgi:Flp pilus assembly protein TadB
VRPLLILAMSDFLEPGGGPEQSGDFRISPSFFIVLFGIGFAVGVVGHLTRSRVLIAVGVLLVMLATVFLPIAVSVSR